MSNYTFGFIVNQLISDDSFSDAGSLIELHEKLVSDYCTFEKLTKTMIWNMRYNLMNDNLDILAKQIKKFKEYYHEYKHISDELVDFEWENGIKKEGYGLSKVAEGHNSFIKNDVRAIAVTYNMQAKSHNIGAQNTPGSKIL